MKKRELLGIAEKIQETNLLNSVRKIPAFNDEPRIHRYIAQINLNSYRGDGVPPDPISEGTSLVPENAFLKSCLEACERYSLANFKFRNFVCGSFNRLKHNYPVAHPDKFRHISEQQKKQDKFQNFSFSDDTSFYWTMCKNLFNKSEIYLPSQLIYCPYLYKNEKQIMLPISTGTALGLSLEDAIYRGICEIIERDAYSITYLLRIPPFLLEYNSLTNNIKDILEKFRKFRLEIKSYLLYSDINVPTILSMILDLSNVAPPISIGLKTDYNLENAIIGSIEEAFQIRTWIKVCMIKNSFTGKTYTEKTVLKRALFWTHRKNLPLLNFITKTPRAKTISRSELARYKSMTVKHKLKMIKQESKEKDFNVYYKDITYKPLEKLSFTVVKCLIPELHPMHLDENYPYHGGIRLEKLKRQFSVDINRVPHPFL